MGFVTLIVTILKRLENIIVSIPSEIAQVLAAVSGLQTILSQLVTEVQELKTAISAGGGGATVDLSPVLKAIADQGTKLDGAISTIEAALTDIQTQVDAEAKTPPATPVVEG